ncbi:cytochrome c/c1 heme-lyase [Protomyces lactucae-debilis]|uniref:Holocytochrome c-type synthase n=1 Tax=Protomyces lactucae-debilis TaxID=2754530 RepID=A0A1Y2F7U7_PROLT|nr:cytochrome c/c1 heme-lyase [Protomyces lactucae-debilis]ORY79951.1 cytochrome c/c1 heme-lyase [Protomyces lactucae-debilis]
MSWFWSSENKNNASSCPVQHTQPSASCPVDNKLPAPPSSDEAASCPVVKDGQVNPRNFMPEFSQRPISARQKGALPTQRTISTIPKAAMDNDPAPPVAEGQKDGLWVYPSPQQFFNAVLKKGFTDTEERDVPAMVQIHNQVNERAWQEILAWEADKAQPCGGPKLVQFRGDATVLTPKARMLGWLGYARPFDTHFWTVDRCGTKVEYVIDFYKGKQGGSSASSGKLAMPSFYLDVRPAGVEGFPSRLARALHL